MTKSSIAIVKNVKDAISRYSMFKPNERVLLCVSGGPDSVAMLYIFLALSKTMDLKLAVAHLNHKLRAKESDGDERFVVRLSKRLKLPIITQSQDVGTYADMHKLSLEEAARRVRYDFFFKAAEGLGINTIATAHTKDDQAETILMRLLRGTGIRGLRGIPPVRVHNGVRIIRPLIGVTRKEIEAYLRQKGIRTRRDSSNLDTSFLRNKVRLELIPLLEQKYNRKLKESLLNLAELLQKDFDYLSHNVDKIFNKIAHVREGNAISFLLSDFKKEHLSIQRGLIRKAIDRLTGGLEGLDFSHWQEIEALLNLRPAGSVVHLPNHMEVCKTNRIMTLSKGPGRRKSQENIREVVLKIPGITIFSSKRVRAQVLKQPVPFSSHPKGQEYFDVAAIALPCVLRIRRTGDRMRPFGMSGTKKLQDLFIDEKVPFEKRDKIPLLVAADGTILWVAEIKRSDKAKITPRTEDVLKVELIK